MHNQETIAAISTAPGTGAIAIVRLSGSKSIEILENIFSSSPNELKRFDWKTRSHEAVHGYIWNPAKMELVDEVVAISYKGPITYTGEDIVEINCHGNPLISQEILNLLLTQGARLSQRGEFTKRAFLSGRMDLTQAEAVLDLIQAPTQRQSRLSVSALNGNVGSRIKEIRAQIMEVLTRVVAGIDFPEEVGEMPMDDIAQIVGTAKDQLERLERTTRTGKYLRGGLRLSIVGRPNAGKSSLLNQFLAYERAIVTEIPGTTRDSLEELFEINGIPIVLIDTAGVRVTDDHVEKIGIERTARAISESDLVLFVLDISQGWGEEEEEIRTLVKGVSYMLVLNKIDRLVNLSKNDDSDKTAEFLRAIDEDKPTLERVLNLTQNSEWTADSLNSFVSDYLVDKALVSAQTGLGMDVLKGKIENFVMWDNQLVELGGSLNQRQGDLCRKAREALSLVSQALEDDLPQDCLATDLSTCIHNLSEACGDEVTEEVISEVFSRFCIGK